MDEKGGNCTNRPQPFFQETLIAKRRITFIDFLQFVLVFYFIFIFFFSNLSKIEIHTQK
jgi:hypothetical protein